MNGLQKTNKGFICTMLHDSDGKYTGCIWQTTIMWDNFERFGNYVSVDMQHRDINTCLWPYTSTTMLNELGKACLGCEGLVCREKRRMSCRS